MITKIKNSIRSLALMLLFAAPIMAPVSVYAAGPAGCSGTSSKIAEGANSAIEGGGVNCTSSGEGNAQDKLKSLARTIVDLLSLLVGIISIIMIIVGGFKYIVSGGDSNKVSGAKNTILFAIVGLIIVALAQLIVKFVLSTATSATNS